MKKHVAFNQGHLLLIGWLSVTMLTIAGWYGHSAPQTAYLAGHESPLHAFITTHFSHHSWSHLGTNLLALAMLLYLFPARISHLIWAFGLTILLTAGYVVMHEIEAYLGFSAMLYAIPGCFLLLLLQRGQWLVGLFMLVILGLHVGFISPWREPLDSHWQPMGSAHLLGFISGLMGGLICDQMNHMRNQPTSMSSCRIDSS